MSQFQYTNLLPASDNGTELTSRLNQWIPAQLSNHSGASRPSYVIAGMIWVDTGTAGLHEIKYYDGSNDVLLYVIDINNGSISFGGGSGSGQNYLGVIDATTTTAPLAPSVGDYYINNTSGDIDASFGLPIANQPTLAGDTLVFDGTEWGLIPTQVDLSGYLPLVGGTLTGPLVLSGPPTLPNHPVTLDYFNQNASAGSLPITGGTLTGPLTLNADPVNLLDASTKQYTDAGLDLKVNKAGDTLTGPLTLSGNPVNALHAATKGFVENWHDPTKLSIAGGILTGLLTLSGNAINPLHAVPKQQMDLALTSVVISSGGPDAGKLVRTSATGRIDASLIALEGAPVFKGFIDPTTVAPAHGAGEYYILEVSGTFDASWGAPIGGTLGEASNIVASDGFIWHYTAGIGVGQYIYDNGLQVLGSTFELVASNTDARTIIDGNDRTLSSIKNVTLQGGEFGAPDNIFSLIYSDTAGANPSASELIKGGIGVNRADFQLWGLDTTDTPTKLLSIPYFSTLSNYAQDDFVRKDGLIWQAKEAVIAGAFDIAQWEVAAPSGVPLMNHSLQYDAETFAVNPDDGKLYVSNQITTGDGTFYPSEWNSLTTVHSGLSGLLADDHPQYHTDARADARYYTQPQVDALVSAAGSANQIFNGSSDITIPVADSDIIATRNSVEKYRVTDLGLSVTGEIAATGKITATNSASNAISAAGAFVQVPDAIGNRGGFRVSTSGGGPLAGITAEVVQNGIYPNTIGLLDIWAQNGAGTTTVARFNPNGETDLYGTLRLQGNLFAQGGLFTGSLQSTDIGINGLTLLPADDAICVKGPSIAHGITDFADTNTAFRIGNIYSSQGGIRFRTFSTNFTTVLFNSISGGSTSSQYGGYRYDLSKANGTGVQLPADTEYHSSWNKGLYSNAPTNIMSLRNDGRLGLLGGLMTGGASQYTDDGGVTVDHGAGANLAFAVASSDVNHGVTTAAATNVYLGIRKANNLLGGGWIRGLTEDNKRGLYLEGSTTGENLTLLGNSNSGAVAVRATLKSGTGLTALSDNASLFSVDNNGLVVEATSGRGDKYLSGGLVTGNNLSPSIKIGGISVLTGDTAGNDFELRSTYVDHGVTDRDSTNVFFAIKTTSVNGIPLITGYSDLTGGMTLRAIGGNSHTTKGTMRFQAYIKSGTGVDAIPADDIAFQFQTSGINILRLHGNGRGVFDNEVQGYGVRTTDKFVSGENTVADCSDGGMTLLTQNLNSITIKDPNINHGVTTENETDTFCSLGLINDSQGGVRFRSYTNSGYSYGMLFDSMVGGTSSSVTSTGPFRFRGRILSGTGGDFIPSQDVFCNWDNNNSRIAWMLGNGDFISTGNIYTNTNQQVLDSASIINDLNNVVITSAQQNQSLVYQGTDWVNDWPASYQEWNHIYSVNITTSEKLKFRNNVNLQSNGSLGQNTRARYLCKAVTSGTSTITEAVAEFYHNGTTWELTKISDLGTSSNHPEFILDVDGDPAIKLYGHTTLYNVRVSTQLMNIGASVDSFIFNGSSKVHINSRNGAINFNFAGQDKVKINTAGKILTGPETNDAYLSTGGLSLDTESDTGHAFVLKKSAVAHGITDAAQTNVFASFGVWNNGSGGLWARGYSESVTAFGVESYSSSATTSKLGVGVYGAIALRASLKSGTGVNAFGANDTMVTINNHDESVVSFTSAGHQYSKGSLFLGNHTASEIHSGGLSIHSSAAGLDSIVLKDNNVIHDMTGINLSNTFFAIRTQSNSEGGARLTGLSEGNVGLQLMGSTMQATSATFTTAAAPIDLRALYSNGAGGVTSFSNDSNILQISNYSAPRVTVKGNGSIYSQANLALGGENLIYSTNGVVATILSSGNDAFVVRRSGLSQPFTGVANSAMAYRERVFSASEGGYQIQAFRAGTGRAINIVGYTEIPNTDGSRGVLSFGAVKIDGGTSSAALDANDDLATFHGGSGSLIRFKGNGGIFTNSGITTGGYSNLADLSDGGIFVNLPSDTVIFRAANPSVVQNFTGVPSNVHFEISRLDNSGFTNISGYCSDGSVGTLHFRTFSDTSNSNYGQFRFQSRLATDVVLPDTAVHTSWENRGFVKTKLFADGTFKTDGNIISGGNISTGGETSPDGTLCIKNIQSTDNSVTLKGPAITHGMTDRAETNTFAFVKEISPALGGLYMAGLSESTYGVLIRGFATNVIGTSVNQAPILIDGQQKSGTSTTSVPSNNNLAIITNNGTPKVRIMAQGQVLTNGFTSSWALADGGLGINGGNFVAPMINLKSSGVAHGMTGIVDTETIFTAGVANNANGGAILSGYSTTGTALLLNGKATAPSTSNGYGAVAIHAQKKSGTAVGSLLDDEAIISFHNNSSISVARITAQGSLYVDHQIKTNGFNANTFLPEGGIGIYTADDAYSARAITIARGSVNHGMTSIADTNVGANIGTVDGAGGCAIFGFSEAARSIYLLGNATTPPTTNNGYGVVAINSRKKSGTTVSSCATNEVIFSVHNNSSLSLFRVAGDGTGHFTGDVYANGVLLGSGGGGLANVVEDTTPQLGGDLDCLTNDITNANQIALNNRVMIGSPSTTKLATNGLAINNIGQITSNILELTDSTNVSHSWTSILSANAYFGIRKGTTTGTARIQTYSSFAQSIYIDALSLTPNNLSTSSAIANIILRALKLNGSLEADLANDENMFCVQNRNTTKLLQKGNGDLHVFGDVYSNDLKCSGQVTAITSQSATTTTTRTSVVADECSMVDISNAVAISYTITNANHAVGATINIMQSGAGQITIALDTGTLSKASTFNAKTSERWSVVTAWKRASTEWVLFGGLEVA